MSGPDFSTDGSGGRRYGSAAPQGVSDTRDAPDIIRVWGVGFMAWGLGCRV